MQSESRLPLPLRLLLSTSMRAPCMPWFTSLGSVFSGPAPYYLRLPGSRFSHLPSNYYESRYENAWLRSEAAQPPIAADARNWAQRNSTLDDNPKGENICPLELWLC